MRGGPLAGGPDFGRRSTRQDHAPCAARPHAGRPQSTKRLTGLNRILLGLREQYQRAARPPETQGTRVVLVKRVYRDSRPSLLPLRALWHFPAGELNAAHMARAASGRRKRPLLHQRRGRSPWNAPRSSANSSGEDTQWSSMFLGPKVDLARLLA